MDGSVAIERNRMALSRIVASLMVMAGLAGFSSPLAGEYGSGRQGEAGPLAEPGEGADHRPTLPRHLWRAILRLLRPAEAAARRLIIAAARGIVVPVPSPRRRKPKPKPKPVDPAPLLRGLGIAVTVPHGARPQCGSSPVYGGGVAPRVLPSASPRTGSGDGGGGMAPTSPARIAFPLLDPPRRILSLSKGRRRMTPAHAAPRIMLPGVIEPHRLPPPPSPDDAVSAARLGRRLAALAAALDDLPGHARRFARWKARREAGLERRHSPLRSGPPPGGRLARYEPGAVASGAQDRDNAGRAARPRARPIREVDHILVHAHELAWYALEHPDTS